MQKRMNRFKPAAAALALMAAVLLTGCVDQSGAGNSGEKQSASGAGAAAYSAAKQDSAAGSADAEGGTKEAASAQSGAKETPYRIVATSPAAVDIMARLDLDLVGVPDTTLSEIPARYDDAVRTGTAMGPDMEVIKTLDPDFVVGPASLQTDLEPKLEAAGLQGVFLNLESVEGLYKSVEQLGTLFDREAEAQAMTDEFSAWYYAYQQAKTAEESPRVLVLMGLPGSYVVATGKSYVGSLVRLAGGTNVYEDADADFITANTEDMQAKDPDIILRAAHAMPEDVVQMFKDEFAQNDIWKHFRAVQKGRVYDLPYDEFGMSAKFNFPAAVETLTPMLYGE